MKKTIEVRPSTGFVPVFVFLFFLFIQIYLFIRTEPEWGSLLLLFILSILIAFSAVVAYLLNAIIMNKKPAQLHIHQSTLELFGRRIDGEAVEAIYSNGYFRPIIGFKRHGKKMIPPMLCFRMKNSGEEDECMEALKHWAMKQGITVKYKRFPRWF
ncbi:hypothetical protein [Paenibacillus sp. PAMC21692]|uniref:hypothetical protein n=1 Tax=Paenibacillus sp. PAMC21692 TaxID=2762320 RepID=UPI00164E40C4|nr:hypothetical protein [Paenibacillus sp. PAMC21692]QNK54588.1 hypothetical protein H7F31_18185 [Paenibacillus sp. PAMC21692]